MEWLTQILSQPITQGGGVIGILIFLHKREIIDFNAILQRVFSSDTKETTATDRNGQQALLSQMELLSQHFNHETTGLLQELRTTQLVQCNKLDLMVDALQDMQRNGIRIRN